MTRHHTIAILGAGCSGVLTAVQLLRAPQAAGLRIHLVDHRDGFGRGLAYRHADDNLVLNVPAGNMSALADAPSHFLAYCQALDPALNAGSFVSRRIYGDYLLHTLAEAERAAPGVLQRVHGQAVAVQRAARGRGFDVQLPAQQLLQADQVVLAVGHFAPANPLRDWPDVASDSPQPTRLLRNPWDLRALDALPRDQPVLLIGSGHTAIDALFRLTSSGARDVWLLSRRGRVPHGHRLTPQAPASAGAPAWLGGLQALGGGGPHATSPAATADTPPTVRTLMRALRREVAACEAAGGDWRDVVNAVRPHAPALWQRLPLAERRRFVARVLPWWDIHRHRLAPTAQRRLAGLLDSGQARCLAGRLLACRVQPDGVSVDVQLRGTEQPQTLQVGAVVNCTGPDTDIGRVASPLLQQLQQQGWVCRDALRLGWQVDADYAVRSVQDQAVTGLYTIGPMLKAAFWEATAVPELRGHAARLAAVLLCNAGAGVEADRPA